MGLNQNSPTAQSARRSGAPNRKRDSIRFDPWLPGYHSTCHHRADARCAASATGLVEEACERLRISRWSFYRLIQQNRLRTVTIGRRRFVPDDEISRFVTKLTESGQQA